jgi:putative DNA methylase
VRTALAPVDRSRLRTLFAELEATVGSEIRALHLSRDSSGEPCEVLYWFWVKQLDCPDCGAAVDLFSSRIFAKHAYVKRFPKVQAVCPHCGEVFACDFGQTRALCPACRKGFDPHTGPAQGANATCGGCRARFPIAKTARAQGVPPRHRLYAKLVLRADGTKEYLRTTAQDEAAYAAAGARLLELGPPLPRVEIQTGYNTRQVLNYGYSRWDQFFNDRQLLGIALLSRAIGALAPGAERDALFVLLSGVLEFNNLFASYKGEGTGAVRHMFSHHVLKPERTPIEANLWGTAKSSGSFLNLFQSRLLRSVDYKAAPFELILDDGNAKKAGRKLFGKSRPMGAAVLDAWPQAGLAPGAVYLSCGDSAATDIPDRTVDAVVTDPPFYDNVHYSELADFFHVWQRIWFGEAGPTAPDTTRSPGEVQDTESDRFADKLKGVFAECHRVLKDEGLLVFSYHHSREDGWTSVAAAVLGAGFKLVQTQPVKAEMSVAMPKLAAKSPIDLDVLMVCRKAAADRRPLVAVEIALEAAEAAAAHKVGRFNGTGRRLSLNDVRIVVYSQALAASLERCAAISQRLHLGQDQRARNRVQAGAEPVQAALF